MADAGKIADYRRLRRIELLELLVEMSRENDRLTEELQAAQEKLADRTLVMENAGSLAEAALALNDIFAAADAACAQYVESICSSSGNPPRETETNIVPAIVEKDEERGALFNEAQSEAQRILAQAEIDAEIILRTAREQAQNELNLAKESAALMFEEAEGMLSEAEAILNELDAERHPA